MSADTEVTHHSDRPLDLAATISTLRRGPGDPCHRVDTDGSIWRTSNMPSGPVTYRLTALNRTDVRCQAWGPGTEQLVDSLPDLLGEADDHSDFAPGHPKVTDAHRRHPGLRIPRTGRVFEALVPAVLEQKVTGVEAFRAWRVLVRQHGRTAPGPAPEGMCVPPTPEQWRTIPSWDYHRAGVDPRRSQTIVRCTRVATQLEGCTGLSHELARTRLMSIPGVGQWTAAEVGQRALGDADALSVGDYHLSAVIGWSLLGRPINDDEMVDYLAPWRPHRHRIVRLLEVSGQAVKPRFGPRMTIQDHRRH
ncbi:DNA-3-methyladenine glycosylase 2 family protein [Nakamurella silvestris]|nr:DNA-3-methyladenine glycosylase 2 family protein [Nakamurella silvestris]